MLIISAMKRKALLRELIFPSRTAPLRTMVALAIVRSLMLTGAFGLYGLSVQTGPLDVEVKPLALHAVGVVEHLRELA